MSTSKSKHTGRWIIAFLLSVVCVVGMAWEVRPWIVQFIRFPLMLAVLVWIPASFWWGFQWMRRRPHGVVRVIALLALIIILECGAALYLNRLWFDQAVREAKAYPQKVAPFMKEYFLAHRGYPAGWEALPQVPRLLRGGGGYTTHGEIYAFYFSDPDVPWDDWHYSRGLGNGRSKIEQDELCSFSAINPTEGVPAIHG